MIFDTYGELMNLGPAFARAVSFLAKAHSGLEAGKYLIDGDRVFALVQHYRTKPTREAIMESHYRYIDIQTCLAGRERIDFTHVLDLKTVTEDPDKDVMFYKPSRIRHNHVEIEPGRAAVFYPHDAHAPGLMAASGRTDVVKLVIKILAD